MNIIKVGMADLKCSTNPCVITTLGLGSCVGVALYDSTTKITGLAHIMLPSSTSASSVTNIAKFADTGIVKLVEDMKKLGARPSSIVAKIAGGAQMFTFDQPSDTMKVGMRNVIAVKAKLSELKISLLSEDTGKNYGRTVEISSADGKYMIKTIGQGIKYI